MLRPIIALWANLSNRFLVHRCAFLERDRLRLRLRLEHTEQIASDLQGTLKETEEKHEALMAENARLHSELGHPIPAEPVRALYVLRGGRHA